MWRTLRELLLPSACAGCGRIWREEAPLCERCDRGIPYLPRGLCRACQALPPRAPTGFCTLCEGSDSPLDACLAGALYRGAAAVWVRRFKAPEGPLGLDPAAEAVVHAWLAYAASQAPTDPDAVVPIPLHPHRIRSRGFAPPLLLARRLARCQGVRLLPELLVRVRDTRSQTGLTRSARRDNLAGAFRAAAPAPARIWLIDDVVTTGATLISAARALRAAGARCVVGLCPVRTPRLE